MTNNSNPLNGYRFDTREKGIETRGEQFAKLVNGSTASNQKADAKQDKEIKKVANDLAAFKKNVYTKPQADGKFLTDKSLASYAKKADVYTKAEVDAKIPPEQDLSSYAKIEYVDNQISSLIAGAPGELDTLKEAADAINANIDNINAISAGLDAKANAADVYTKSEVDGLIPDVSEKVDWVESEGGRKHIVLPNHSNLLGTDTDGGTYNLAMVSKWNVADFGTSQLHMNLNSVDGNVTINDDKQIATVDQIPDVIVNFTETGRDETNPNSMMISGTTDLSQSEIAELIAAGKAVYLNVNDSEGNVVKYMSPTGGNTSVTGPGETDDNFLFNFMQDGNNVVFYVNRIASQRNLESTNERVTALENGQYHNVFVNFTETGRETLDNGVVKISGTTDFSETEIAEFISQGLSVYINTNDSDGNVAKYMSAQGGQVSMLEVNDDPEAFLFSFEQNGNDVVFYARGLAKAGESYTKAEVDAMLAEKQAEIDAIIVNFNKLKEIVGDLGGNVEYSVPADGKFSDMIKKSGVVKLTEDTVSGTYTGGITSKNITTLNLGGKTLEFTGATTTNPGIMAKGKQQYTITGGGKIDAGGRIAIEANGEDVVINLGGTMFGRPTYVNDRSGAELIYCYLGTINITEGIFKNNGEDKSCMLNCYDANYRDGKANIIVTGGKFYDFDPANNTAEGPGTSFVPDGYESVPSVVEEDGVEHTVYTVKKIA